MAQTRRRADAARNDDLLLDAALELLREKGPDRIAALDLARLAKLTTGAVYARYENNEEILVGLWQHRISGPMRAFFEASLPAMNPGPRRAEAQAIMAKTISNPHGPLRPGIALLIASSRIPELQEIIVPEVQGWLRDMGISDDRSDVQSLQKLGIIGFVLGCLYFAAADMFDFADWESIKPLAHFVLANPSIDGLAKNETRQPHKVTVHSENETRDALVTGAARVIARGGIERATTQRISRASGLPPSALFTEYRTRQVLFNDVAEKLLRAIYRQSRSQESQGIGEVQTQQSSSTPTDYDDPRLVAHRHQVAHTAAAHLQALIAPEGLEQRRLRLEFHLAAITDPDIHEALTQADAAATQFTASQMKAAFGIPTEIAEPLMRMSRLLGQGHMLLEEISHFLHGRDLRYIFKPLGEAISLRVINAELTPSNS